MSKQENKTINNYKTSFNNDDYNTHSRISNSIDEDNLRSYQDYIESKDEKDFNQANINFNSDNKSTGEQTDEMDIECNSKIIQNRTFVYKKDKEINNSSFFINKFSTEAITLEQKKSIHFYTSKTNFDNINLHQKLNNKKIGDLCQNHPNKLFYELKNIRGEIESLEKSMPHIYSNPEEILGKKYELLMRKQELEKNLCKNIKLSELKVYNISESENKQFYYIKCIYFHSFLFWLFHSHVFKIIKKFFKIPKYIKEKEQNHGKFYQIGVRAAIFQCAQSLENSISFNCKNYNVRLRKLSINNQLGCKNENYRNFFNLFLIDIYSNLSPKKQPKDKKGFIINKKEIIEKNKKLIKKLIKKEENNGKVENKILNILFTKTTFKEILESFLLNHPFIEKSISDNETKGRIELNNFQTYENCLNDKYDKKTKEELKIRIFKIIKGDKSEIKTRKSRKIAKK